MHHYRHGLLASPLKNSTRTIPSLLTLSLAQRKSLEPSILPLNYEASSYTRCAIFTIRNQARKSLLALNWKLSGMLLRSPTAVFPRTFKLSFRLEEERLMESFSVALSPPKWKYFVVLRFVIPAGIILWLLPPTLSKNYVVNFHIATCRRRSSRQEIERAGVAFPNTFWKLLFLMGHRKSFPFSSHLRHSPRFLPFRLLKKHFFLVFLRSFYHTNWNWWTWKLFSSEAFAERVCFSSNHFASLWLWLELIYFLKISARWI